MERKWKRKLFFCFVLEDLVMISVSLLNTPHDWNGQVSMVDWNEDYWMTFLNLAYCGLCVDVSVSDMNSMKEAYHYTIN
jgi:hypothetical protein